MRAFEAFKATNDERLGQIEKRLSADVVTTEKLDRINRALDEHKRIVDELALKSARPQLGGLDLPLGLDPAAQGRLRGLRAQRRGRTACASSRRRRCRSAPAPTAAISCPTRPSAPSTAR